MQVPTATMACSNTEHKHIQVLSPCPVLPFVFFVSLYMPAEYLPEYFAVPKQVLSISTRGSQSCTWIPSGDHGSRLINIETDRCTTTHFTSKIL